jgi:hypothetical protein
MPAAETILNNLSTTSHLPDHLSRTSLTTTVMPKMILNMQMNKLTKHNSIKKLMRPMMSTRNKLAIMPMMTPSQVPLLTITQIPEMTPAQTQTEVIEIAAHQVLKQRCLQWSFR